MSNVRAVYLEYEDGRPPFAWMDGRRLTEARQVNIHKLLAGFSRPEGRGVGSYGEAVRIGGTLMLATVVGVDTTAGVEHRAVVAVQEAGQPVSWATATAALVARILSDGDVRVEQGRLRSALEMGWAAAARPFLKGHGVRSLAQYCGQLARYFAARIRRRVSHTRVEEVSKG